jgi:hypothetical protein
VNYFLVSITKLNPTSFLGGQLPAGFTFAFWAVRALINYEVSGARREFCVLRAKPVAV